jgi:hypothetical protein
MDGSTVGVTSVEAMRMFGIIADHLSAKPDRKGISERVMELVDGLHVGGFVIVPTSNGSSN